MGVSFSALFVSKWEHEEKSEVAARKNCLLPPTLSLRISKDIRTKCIKMFSKVLLEVSTFTKWV